MVSLAVFSLLLRDLYLVSCHLIFYSPFTCFLSALAASMSPVLHCSTGTGPGHLQGRLSIIYYARTEFFFSLSSCK